MPVEQKPKQLEEAIAGGVARLDLWTELIAGFAKPVPSYDVDEMIQNTAQSVQYDAHRGASFHDHQR
jgi:hypothetical protein